MAKEQRDGKAKVRICFGFAEVEGGDATIQDGLRTFAAAMSRVSQQPAQVRVVKALPAAGKPSANGNGTAERPSLFDEVDPSTDQEVVDDAELIPEGEFEPVEENREKKPRQPRKGVTYSFVPDLNLKPAGKPKLKDFYAEKKPKDQQEETAVFVYYLKRTLGVTGVGVNHLFQCFKEVEKRVPKDILLVTRNAAYRKGWINVSNSNDLGITTQGENFVEHDLPRATSD